ncbi:hypothetical protein CMALT394_580001 [Carnobacterium maltaromaticum]|nr:hypothetical protein CMALT394_580001 [Carnobacterium maltaromaticum]
MTAGKFSLYTGDQASLRTAGKVFQLAAVDAKGTIGTFGNGVVLENDLVSNRLTANEYNIIMDQVVSGETGNNLANVKLYVNGVLKRQVRAVNGAYEVYAKDVVTKATDKVEIVGFDANGFERNRVKVKVNGESPVSYNITAEAYNLATGENVKGTADAGVARVQLLVNDKEIRTTAVVNGTYSIYAQDVIQDATDKVEIVALDQSGLAQKKISVTVLDDKPTNTLVKEITSIPEPTWIFNSGMSKGKYHDRQDLGFILRENTVLSVRQVNPNFKDNLTVRLLGNDSQTEKNVSVGIDWTQISGTEPLVPFVDTPYGSTSAQLEYKIEDSRTQNPLPTYQYNTSVNDFFNTWNQSDGNYALIKGNDFQLLVPKGDKELVRNLKDYASLDELIEHYNDLFAYYNQMAGFDHSSVENQNGENRYFLKADSHGAGGAYYGANWTANSYATVDMWLTKIDWATLHEIAHGYQAGFDGRGMYTGEVSNNLFGVQYQYEKYGKKADDIGWLFNYGKKENIENNLYKKMITNQGTYDSADLREKLILLTMLKQKAGNDAFTKMYQEYRKLANQPNFDKADYLLPDLINKYYSETSRQDFTPALKKWGLTLDESQSTKNRFMGYPAVASLADLVPESQLSRAHDLLDDPILINSNFEMVQNQDIANLNLSGNLTLQLKSEDIQDLKGIKITLQDGRKKIDSQTIGEDQIIFKDIPNGIYSLKFSGEKMSEYVPDNFYVYVKEKENEAAISLNKINVSNLVNQKIQFLGLGNQQFGSFSTNLNNHEALFSITDKNPHSYFSGEGYSKLTVKGSNEVIKYEKSVEGTNATVGVDQISLNEGDRLEIYHAESKNRLRSSESIIDINQQLNRWIMTRWGLQNQSLHNDPQKDLIKKIDSKGTILLEEEENNPISLEESTDKKQLLSAIKLLEEPYKTQYMKKFISLFK